MLLSLIPLALKFIPAILGLIQSIVQTAHDNKLLAAGQAEAIAEGARQVQAQVEIARQAEADAEKRHAKDKTDTAFDKDFQRKD